MNVTNEVHNDVVLGAALEGRQFTVNSDAAFFDILSNTLYTNPTLAVIRETITNAVDANKEAGITDPVEVTYDDDKRILTITDKGNGIPHDKIHEIYCVYGNSTKRDNDSTGGFGLGCKSPFAVTNSFTVINSNGGIKKTYILAKRNGIPEIIDINGEEPSNKSGITLIIPMEDKGPDKVHLIREFVYFAGINVVLNGELLATVHYEDAGVYYVSKKIVNQTTTNTIFLGKDITVRYGTNVFNLPYMHKAEDIDRLRTLINNWGSLYQDIRLNYRLLSVYKYMCTLTANVVPVINVPANSIDISPNRETVRYTPKTLETLTKLITKEINKLKGGLNTNSWLDIYKNNRLNAYLGNDNIISLLGNKYFIQAKDIISQKKDSNSLNNNNITKMCYAVSRCKDKTLFNDNEKEYTEFIINNEHLLEKIGCNTLTKDIKVLEELNSKVYAIEQPLYNCLLKAKYNSFNYRGATYSLNMLKSDDLYLIRCFMSYSNWKQILFYKLFKIVVISNYTATHADSPMRKELENALPEYFSDAVLSYAYCVRAQSKQRADMLQGLLEKEGYYVINIVKDREKNTNSPKKSKTLEIINNLENKDRSYYFTRDAENKLYYLKKPANTDLYKCFFENAGFYSSTLDLLYRYRTYEGIEVTNRNSIAVFKKHNIKSIEEVFAAEVKDMLEEDTNLRIVYSMFYLLSNNSSNCVTSSQLKKVLWFVLQSEELTTKYKLPLLTVEDFKKLCFINSFVEHNPSYALMIRKSLTTKGRVGKFLARTTNYSEFNLEWSSVLSFVCGALKQFNAENYTKNPQVEALVISILDSLFSLEKDEDNE